MKVLGIVGSLRKGGNTEVAVKSTLTAIQDLGVDTELICLSDFKVGPCDGCGKCKKGSCHINDDMIKLIPKIESADAFVIGSPVYYGGISGGLKCFLDRCRPLKLNGNLLRGKIGGAIAVGKIWGHANVLDTILHFYGSQGIISIPINSNPGLGVQFFATKIGDSMKDESGQKAACELGKKIVDYLYKLQET